MDEFIVTKSKKNNLNKDIQEFRIENPNYEIFNISAVAGGEMSHKFWVIWRKIN